MRYLTQGNIERSGQDLRDLRQLIDDIQAHFREAGADDVEPGALLSADILLDLYGEDIRARAYIMHDPVAGERMLRPDFTVPVTQMHMEGKATPARYTYAGPVWRRQDSDTKRPSEVMQVGLEIFSHADPVAVEVEVFTLFHQLLAADALSIAIGDMGILSAAIEGLPTTKARKNALSRHMWRPHKFRKLLARYSNPLELSSLQIEAVQAFQAGQLHEMLSGYTEIGLRALSEIETRIETLLLESQTERLSKELVMILGDILEIRASAPKALSRLRDLEVDMPSIGAALDQMSRRLDVFAAHGIAPETLFFEASYGRTNLEYYNGFVFGFYDPNSPDLPPIAGGGRYDALVSRLSQQPVPAVGGIIRPEYLLAYRER